MDMSEALFNELAFFKLMEGLGEPASYSGEDEYCSSATQVSSLISSILYLSNIIEVWRGMPINRYQYCSCNTLTWFDLTAIINISLSQTLAYDDESGMQHLVQTDESDTTETVTDEEEETLNSSVRVNDREEEEEELGKVNPPPNLTSYTTLPHTTLPHTIRSHNTLTD